MSQPRTIRRGRLQLIALTAFCLLPFVGALVAIQVVPGFRPFGTANYGTLVTPVVPVGVDGLMSLDPIAVDEKTFTGIWSLILFSRPDCAQLCRQQLYLTRQVRLLLNKDARRLQRVLVLPAESEAGEGFEAVMKAFPGLRAVSATPAWRNRFSIAGEPPLVIGSVYLVDPQGFLMMYYQPEFEPKAMLKDLKRLLKTSRLG